MSLPGVLRTIQAFMGPRGALTLVGCCVLLLGGATAQATTIDFSSGGSGNMGASLSFSPVTITAKSHLLAGANPLNAVNSPGTVYWGNLGSLDDPDCGRSGCYGLGVQNAGGGGSKGISGDGGDQDEALIFTWNAGSNVSANTVSLLLLGINTGSKSDIVNVVVRYAAGGSDLTFNGVSLNPAAPTWLNLSALAGVNAGAIGSVSVGVVQGHAGVGGLNFNTKPPVEPVPEPGTLVMLLAGLGGLAVGLIRKRA